MTAETNDRLPEEYPAGGFSMQRPMERQRKQAQRTFFAAQWTTYRVVRSEAERTGLLRKAFPVCTPVNSVLPNAGTQFCEKHPSAQPGEDFRVLPAIRGGGPLVLVELAPCGSTQP